MWFGVALTVDRAEVTVKSSGHVVELPARRKRHDVVANES